MTPQHEVVLEEVEDVEEPVRIDQEEARVCDWRFDSLGWLGVEDTTERLDLAASDMDVWDLRRLLAMKCPLDLAIRIVR